MGLFGLQRFWVVLVVTEVVVAQNTPSSYVQASNTAGSLFTYLENPVITQPVKTTPAGTTGNTTAPVPSQGNDTAEEPSSAPPPAVRNPATEQPAIPIGDSSIPPSRAGPHTRPTRYGVGTQPAATSDQNFNLRLTNQDLTTTSDQLLTQIRAAQRKLDQYQQLQTEETDQYAEEETALNSSNANLNVTNEGLEEQVANMTERYQGVVSQLRDYQESLQNAELNSERLSNYTETMREEFTSAQSELERIQTVQGAASIGFPLAEPRPISETTDGEQGTVSGLLRRNSGKEASLEVTGSNTTYSIVQVVSGSDSNDDNADDLEASTDMVYVVALAMLFLLLSTLRVWLGHHIDAYLTSSLYTLFFDIAVLTMLTVVTGVLYHMGWFDRDKIDLKKIVYGLCIFILFWFLLGLWFVLSAQSMARTWFRAEGECMDLRRVSQNYEDAYLEYNAEEGPRIGYRQFAGAQSAMQYAVMRQEFICPTYLPYTTEMFLRSDFNLADYLSKCLGDIIDHALQLTGIGFLVLLICVGTWRLCIYFGFKTELTLFIIIPVVCILTSLILLEKLKSIYFQLVPYVLDPHEFHLPADNFSRNPMMNVEKVPIPPYLTGSLEYLQSPANPYTCCGTPTNPLKLTCAYIFIGKFPNRHELLFWFDSYGPQFVLGMVQGVALILTFWMVVILIYYVPMLFDKLEVWGIMAAIAAVLIWLFAAFYLLPETLRVLTLTSRIEQMKDRRIIDSVIISSRNQRAIKTVQLYRQIKLIYREMSRDEGKAEFQGGVALPDTMEKHIQEVFNLTCDVNTQLLEIPQLSDALELCGVTASNDELRVFIWETDAVRGM